MEGLETAFAEFGNALPSFDVLMWLLFYLILAYTILHAAIFVYHWNIYNIAPKRFLRLTYVIYFVGIVVFLGMVLFSTIAILS